MEKVLMPAEPPPELVNVGGIERRTDGTPGVTFDEVLFDLCREDDYAGLYREFVRRYALQPLVIVGDSMEPGK